MLMWWLPQINKFSIYIILKGVILSDCTKPAEEGFERCRARIPVFWWNNSKQKCEKVWYGGCHGTKNNFVTEDKCISLAEKICKQ